MTYRQAVIRLGLTVSPLEMDLAEKAEADGLVFMVDFGTKDIKELADVISAGKETIARIYLEWVELEGKPQ